jgi:predicted NACHT family NTPase
LVEFSRFIELDRRFIDVTELADPEESALRSYTASLLGKEAGISWPGLLKSRIVVILGEPGSGKTWELRNQAMNTEGTFLSYLRNLRLNLFTVRPFTSVEEGGVVSKTT